MTPASALIEQAQALSVLPTAIHLWRDNRHEIMARLKARFGRQREPEVD